MRNGSGRRSGRSTIWQIVELLDGGGFAHTVSTTLTGAGEGGGRRAAGRRHDGIDDVEQCPLGTGVIGCQRVEDDYRGGVSQLDAVRVDGASTPSVEHVQTALGIQRQAGGLVEAGSRAGDDSNRRGIPRRTGGIDRDGSPLGLFRPAGYDDLTASVECRGLRRNQSTARTDPADGVRATAGAGSVDHDGRIALAGNDDEAVAAYGDAGGIAECGDGIGRHG